MASEKQLINIERQRLKKLEREHKIIDGLDHKICNKHHIYFPKESPWIPATLDNFYYNDKNKTDHLHPECKRCGIKKSREWNVDNSEQWKENLNKVEQKPERILSNRKRSEKQRKAGKQDKWRKDNPEKSRASSRFKHMNATHKITSKEWEACLLYFNHRCAYCGKKLEDHYNMYMGKLRWESFHKEHVIHKGNNDLSNCVPSCKSCNSKKHTFDFKTWYTNYKYYDIKKFNKIIKWLESDYKSYIEENKVKKAV